jgi:hypothetical protein
LTVLVHRRRWIGWAAAALVVWLAAPAQGQVVAPANDGGAPADAAVTEAGRADAVPSSAPAPSPAPAPSELATPPAPAPSPAPASSELATPPELTSAQMSTTTSLIGVPTPAQVEEPRPITRRLWFWMAITGVIVVGSLVGMALYNPNTTRPECPSGYVCPP